MGLIILLVMGDAYWDKKIAEVKPTGIATVIAIMVIKRVPAKIGIAPKDPWLAT